MYNNYGILVVIDTEFPRLLVVWYYTSKIELLMELYVYTHCDLKSNWAGSSACPKKRHKSHAF